VDGGVIVRRILTVVVLAMVAMGVAVPPVGSADLSEWTIEEAPQPNQWRGIAFGNGTFVAVASSGPPYAFPEPFRPVMTSPDGITWTARDAPAGGWSSLAFGGGTFVAVGETTDVMTSSDGIGWTTHPTPAGTRWSNVIYGNGVFVAVSSAPGAPVMTSVDGVNWTLQSAPDGGWGAMAYGNGTFVVVGPAAFGPNRLMTSPDGVTWTVQDSPTDDWAGLAFGNGRFVAKAGLSPTTVALTSTDGVTWTEQASPSSAGLAFGDGVFLTSSPSGVYSSADGVTWVRTGAPEGYWVLGHGGQAWIGLELSGSRIIRSGPPAAVGPAPAVPVAAAPVFTG
jgi:hypothetical protein